jgi:hypothetical protein
MSPIRYYYPSDAEESLAIPGFEIEVSDDGAITVVVDANLGQPAQVVTLTRDKVMRLAGALNRAALCALPGGSER